MSRKDLKKVIILTGTILISVLLVDKLVFFSLNRISDKVMSGYLIGKVNHYLACKDTTEILIYGSSRTNHHVDAGMMPAPAFNMGLDGVRLDYATALIKMLPPDTKQVVLLHVDSYGPEFEGENLKLLLTKYHREPVIREEIQKAKQQHPLQDVFWSLDYNGTVLGIARNLVAPSYDYRNYTGFDPEVITGERREAINLMLLDDAEEAMEPMKELHPLAGDYLLEIRDFCQQNNKELIAFTSPKFRYKSTVNDKALAEFLAQHGIVYLDFTQLYGDDVPLDWWRDKTHLTAESARLFTRHLIKELNNLSHAPLSATD